jgi:hypothetical protein
VYSLLCGLPDQSLWIEYVYLVVKNGAVGMAAISLPFVTLTIIRRTATGHWRFGPRW